MKKMPYTGTPGAIVDNKFDTDTYDTVKKAYDNLDVFKKYNDIAELFKGATKFEKISGDGSIGSKDVYQITFNDMTTTEFEVTNGSGISDISRTSGDGSPGTTDTYTISTTDGSIFTFDIYNGKDSDGDMLKSVYDKNDNGIVDNSELLNGKDNDFLLDRANHSGTQDIDTITENLNKKIMTKDERDKLANMPIDFNQLLSNKEDKSNKGVANGYAELDSSGKVPSTQLPSYVDDVLEFNDRNSFPQTGEPHKIYISIADDTSWRWTGTTYVDISGAVDSVNGKTGVVVITKDDINLNNVDNTSDLNKPISSAATFELNKKENLSNKSKANGYASLDSNGKVPSSELPNISSLTLGETSSTAYRGDRGKVSYDHSQLKSGNPHNVSKADIGLDNVDNTSDANKPISNATQLEINNLSTSINNKLANDYLTASSISSEYATKEENTFRGFKNYIINGDNRISQFKNNLNQDITINTFTIDMFKTDVLGVNVRFNYPSIAFEPEVGKYIAVQRLTVTGNQGQGYFGLRQFIESGNYKLYNKNITVSAWVKSNSPNARLIGLGKTSNAHSGNNKWEKLSYTIKPSNTNSSLYYAGVYIISEQGNVTQCNIDDYIEFTDLQVEEGLEVTRFEVLNDGISLSLCQRYYQEINYFNARSINQDESNLITVPYKTKMITKPTIRRTTDYISSAEAGTTVKFIEDDSFTITNTVRVLGGRFILDARI